MQVLPKESSHVRTIALNRPKQLNALSFEMMSRLLELFHAYEENPDVRLIIMKVWRKEAKNQRDSTILCKDACGQRYALKLKEKQLTNFLKGKLRTLKSILVDGVMVDSWWGIMETNTPQHYKWKAYKKLLHAPDLKVQVSRMQVGIYNIKTFDRLSHDSSAR
ncbi:hypothetical protein L1887_04431 [Cichorium endivia]|nr:hypothetical protein L1887_04431 [Cichorium endivia]